VAEAVKTVRINHEKHEKHEIEQGKPRLIGRAMTTDEIVDTLTDGWRPIEQCFLFHGDICTWNSEMQIISTKLIDEDELWIACEQFLMSRDQSCGSMEDVRRLAKKFKWPNWNR
jgi:hypothetical protein